MTRPTGTTVGCLLAAGAGVRYGTPKVLAQHGAWLRDSVSALLDGGCDRVVVVLGAADAPMPPGASAVRAADWASGMAASLRAGLEECSRDPDAIAAVLHVIDTPDVGADVVATVLARARATPRGLARAYFGTRPGHPVVVPRALWDELAESVVGDEGGRRFFAEQRETVKVQCEHLATGADVDFNNSERWPTP